MSPELAEMRKRFLRLLEEDEEFRYTVAGYLGLSEVMRRLDRMGEEQVRLREEQLRMREEFGKRFEAHEAELRALREDFNRMQKTIEGMQGTMSGMQETISNMQRTINGMQRTIEGILRTIEGMQKTIEGTQRTISGMQMTIEGMLRAIDRMDKRLTRVERTLEKLTLDIEEEGRSIVAHKLRGMGIYVELDRLQLPGLELNIYGATDELCVIGECSVRAGPALLDELKHKVEALRERYPGLLRPKTVLIVYVSLALPELVEVARREGVWVLKATADITEPPGHL